MDKYEVFLQKSIGCPNWFNHSVMDRMKRRALAQEKCSIEDHSSADDAAGSRRRAQHRIGGGVAFMKRRRH
jgi:hypothetical protein